VVEQQGRTGRSKTARRISAGFMATAAASLLLTGCAAGQHAATIQQLPAVDGAIGNSGSVGIRLAGIETPEDGKSWAVGSNAPLQFVLVNNGTQPDKLNAIVSEAAGGASLANKPASTTASPGASFNEPIDIPAGGSVNVGMSSDGATAVLNGLKKELFPAESVPVTFVFASGGQISVNLPVRITEGEQSAPTLPIAPSSHE